LDDQRAGIGQLAFTTCQCLFNQLGRVKIIEYGRCAHARHVPVFEVKKWPGGRLMACACARMGHMAPAESESDQLGSTLFRTNKGGHYDKKPALNLTAAALGLSARRRPWLRTARAPRPGRSGSSAGRTRS